MPTIAEHRAYAALEDQAEDRPLHSTDINDQTFSDADTHYDNDADSAEDYDGLRTITLLDEEGDEHDVLDIGIDFESFEQYEDYQDSNDPID